MSIDPYVARAPGEPPPDSAAALGLLRYLNAHALDDDYREVAARPPDQRPRRNGRGTILVLAVFTLLLLTAASQTSRDAVTDARERQQLAEQIDQRRTSVEDDTTRIAQLRIEVAELRAQLAEDDTTSAGAGSQLSTLALSAGTADVRGPGVSVTVDDAPGATSDRSRVLDSDLQQLVNGLWAAGAEAIAVNDQRLTNLSAIRQAGSAITVNFVSLKPPYVVEAIGDPATLPERFADTSSGQTWLDLQKQVGLQFTMRTRTSLRLPGASTPRLRYAAEVPGGDGSPAGKSPGTTSGTTGGHS